MAIATLILWWLKSRWTPVPVAIALAVLLIASSNAFNAALIRTLEWQHVPDDELPNAEAIVLLGGCTKSQKPPRPMVDITEGGDRIFYAAQLYRDGKAPLVIAAGGRVGWRGSGSPEAADMAKLLEFLSVPHDAILLELNSLNTRENAVNVKRLLDQRGLKRVLLVTSAMHMPRALRIFQRLGIKAIPAPTDFLTTADTETDDDSIQAILLALLPDASRLATTTSALKEYIGMIIYRLRGWV
ncbi:MAG: YdcF family protein [Spirulinaceae cyanobacterium RM2_2_10]|nr:YdcF family protein [Spirulinaceae cyanobacterium SM2_1_0]NJO20307.1 YdcF family protein [Spirulinaceae cyanobacterium RM2_2_10]